MSILSRFLGKRKKAEPEKAPPSGRLSIVGKMPRPLSRIWTIGGGKGGVGKSVVAANFGTLLAGSGRRTLIVDADFGAANLHTLFGIQGSNPSLSSFLKSEVTDIKRLITGTGIQKLDIITGAMDSLNIADVDASSLMRLQRAISELDYDHVVLDLSPGTSSGVLDCFLMSDEGILVTTPEPTSIENTYRFMKCLFLRRIRAIINSGEPGRLKETLKAALERDPRIGTVSEFMKNYKLSAGAESAPEEILGGMGGHLVVNRTRLPEDRAIGPHMQRACMSYFGVRFNHLGDIGQDTSIEDSVRARRPLVRDYPGSPAALSLVSCFRKLASIEQEKAGQEAAKGLMQI